MNMRFIINTIDDKIKSTYDKMIGNVSAKWNGQPRIHAPKVGEIRILNGIEEIDILKGQYKRGNGVYIRVQTCIG